jgi:hypothetical protein
MSKNINQVFIANPITTNAATDLMYFGQSPYGVGNDAAMTYANFSAQFSSKTLTSAHFFVGNGSNVATDVAMSGDAALANTGAVTVSKIGGVSISLAGSFTTSGAFAVTQTYTGITNVTFPTSGTLATTAGTVANATNIGITDDTTTNATMFPVWVTANTGFLPAKVTSTKMTFNPSTGALISSTIGASSISTFVPSTTLESATQAGSNTITSSSYVTSATSGARFIGQHARNTYASPQALANNDIIATFGCQGYGATGFSSSAVAYVKMFAAEAWSDTAQGTKITIATTPNTTIVPVDAITISNAGVVAFPVAPLGSSSGGTGVNNGSSTITLGGSLTTSGAFASTFTMTNTTSVTFPTSGTLATTSQLNFVTWNDVSGTSQAAAVNSGYIISNAGQTTVTLPATAAEGTVFAVQGKGAAGWILQANTGQVIHLGSSATSSAGSLTSTNQWDSVTIVCVTANTTFAVTSVIGNLTVA